MKNNVADYLINCFEDDGLEDIKEIFKTECFFGMFLQGVARFMGDTARHCLMVKGYEDCYLIIDDLWNYQGYREFFTTHKEQTKKW